jgi:hypothetical protein
MGVAVAATAPASKSSCNSRFDTGVIGETDMPVTPSMLPDALVMASSPDNTNRKSGQANKLKAKTFYLVFEVPTFCVAAIDIAHTHHVYVYGRARPRQWRAKQIKRGLLQAYPYL